MKVKILSLHLFCLVQNILTVELIQGEINWELHSKVSKLTNPPPETFMSTPQLITHSGYPVQQHKVKTNDGYILTLFRIPHQKLNSPASPPFKLKPIFLQHGFLCSSDDWLLLLPPEDNLPYLLADNGWDVWLGNSRGNNYSMEHVKLDPRDSKFWDFSFHEMGHDLPKIIDHILSVTGMDQLAYVGHSMGTAIFFIAMDQYPQYQSKISKMVALAPAVYVHHAKSPVRLLAGSKLPGPLKGFWNLFRGGRIIPKIVNGHLKKWGPFLCIGNVPKEFCLSFIFFIMGFNYRQTTNVTAAMILGHTPSDASVKTLQHYLQFIQRGKFEYFNYGPTKNIIKYKSVHPPMYNLTKINVPVKVLYGSNDWLVVPQDALRTIKELGRASGLLVNYKDWNHLDFTYGRQVKEFVYNTCLNYLNSPL